ncbi:Eukaryotic peptide chain release factor GTP-binding subunit [Blastocladiella emersonii ATCC 22665]|nr:Eukaryotic peptide chain release factor GTP-binding subunit [Blastocladiella emersonii ATCC 22665]
MIPTARGGSSTNRGIPPSALFYSPLPTATASSGAAAPASLGHRAIYAAATSEEDVPMLSMPPTLGHYSAGGNNQVHGAPQPPLTGQPPLGRPLPSAIPAHPPASSYSASGTPSRPPRGSSSAQYQYQPPAPPPPPPPKPGHAAGAGGSAYSTSGSVPSSSQQPLAAAVSPAVLDPPMVWSEQHMRQLMEHGWPAAIPFQGANAVVGVRSLRVDHPPDAGGGSAQPPLNDVSACARLVFGIPPLEDRSAAASLSKEAGAGGRRRIRRPPRTRIFVTAHDRRAFAVTIFLLTVLPVLYYVFVAPAVMHDISVALIAVTVFLHVTTMLALMMTSLSDPGIMPRFTHLVFDHQGGGQRMLDADPVDAAFQGREFQIKYCQTCKIYRGPRTFHCSTCDNCVANHDHHCPYTSNCIGAGNYRYFVTFVTHAAFLNIAVLGQCIGVLVRYANNASVFPPRDFGSALAAHPVAFALALVGAIIALSLLPLTGYHWYLLLRNLTTHEHVRFGPERAWRNPWHRTSRVWGCGPLANLAWVLCRPLPASHLRWYRRDRGLAERPSTQAHASRPHSLQRIDTHPQRSMSDSAAAAPATLEVRLVTSDKKTVTTTHAIVAKSVLLKNILEDCAEDMEVPLPNVSERALKRVLEWLEHHVDDEVPEPDPDQDEYEAIEALRQAPVSDWDTKFMDIPQSDIIELTLAANYLEIKPLLDLACKMLARMLDACKTEEEIREKFNLPDDLTEEEKVKIRAEFAWADAANTNNSNN